MTIPNIILSILSDMKSSNLIADFTYQTPGKSNVVASQMECPMAILSTFTDFLISANRRSESAEVNLFFLNRQTLDFDGVEDLNNPDKKGTPEDLCFNFLNRLTQYRYLETENVKMSSTFDSNDTNLTGYALQMRITDKRSFCIDDEEWTRSTLYVNSTENGTVTYDVAGYSKAVVSTNVAQPQPEWPEYLRITALEPSTVKNGGASVMKSLSVEYSKNGGEWQRLEGQTVSLDTGEYAEFRSSEYGLYFGGNSWRFSITGKTHLSGNIGSMLNKSLNGTIPTYALAYLFKDCTGICSVDEHFLEGSIPGNHSFTGTFYGCSNMVNAPILPDVLDEYCFTYMFDGCTSLTKAYLPAREGKKGCYEYMFYGCSSLNEVTCHIDQINLNRCAQWLTRTSPTGVVKCPSTTIIASLPSGWVRENI